MVRQTFDIILIFCKLKIERKTNSKVAKVYLIVVEWKKPVSRNEIMILEYKKYLTINLYSTFLDVSLWELSEGWNPCHQKFLKRSFEIRSCLMWIFPLFAAPAGGSRRSPTQMTIGWSSSDCCILNYLNICHRAKLINWHGGKNWRRDLKLRE